MGVTVLCTKGAIGLTFLLTYNKVNEAVKSLNGCRNKLGEASLLDGGLDEVTTLRPFYAMLAVSQALVRTLPASENRGDSLHVLSKMVSFPDVPLTSGLRRLVKDHWPHAFGDVAPAAALVDDASVLG